MGRLAALPLVAAVALLAGCAPAGVELPPTRTPLTLPTLRPSPAAAPTAATASPVVAVEVQPTALPASTPTGTVDPAFFSPSPEGALSDLVPIAPEVAPPGPPPAGPPAAAPVADPPASELAPLNTESDLADDPGDGTASPPEVEQGGFSLPEPVLPGPDPPATPDTSGLGSVVLPQPVQESPPPSRREPAPPAPIVPEAVSATPTAVVPDRDLEPTATTAPESGDPELSSEPPETTPVAPVETTR